VLAVGGEEGLVAILDIATRSILARSQTVLWLHYHLSLNSSLLSFFSTVSSFICITLSLKRVRRTGSAVSCSVVDRHQNDADPDPDPIFHVDVDRDPDLDPTPSWKIIYFFYFYSQQFTLFYLSRQHNRCHNFQYFGKYIEIF
jgi:hypothetical protein